MARSFENDSLMIVRLFRIKASENLQKKISKSYLQRRKMEKQREKELFTT